MSTNRKRILLVIGMFSDEPRVREYLLDAFNTGSKTIGELKIACASLGRILGKRLRMYPDELLGHTVQSEPPTPNAPLECNAMKIKTPPTDESSEAKKHKTTHQNEQQRQENHVSEGALESCWLRRCE